MLYCLLDDAVVLVSVTNSSDANMSMMMIETRQQNTEVRVSLSKITDKVDRVSEKVWRTLPMML